MVLVPLFFIVAIFSFHETFSLFESNRVDTSSIPIAKWQVEINDDDINGSSSTFTIDNVVWIESQNVKSGKVAP